MTAERFNANIQRVVSEGFAECLGPVTPEMDARYARVALRAIAMRDELEAESSANIKRMWDDREHRIPSDASEKE